MGFVGVYKAVYDYAPQGEGELQITEGDLLYVLEKSTDDDWWKAKKKATGEDEDEPVGLIPNNYVEEVCAVYNRSPRCWGIVLTWLVLPAALGPTPSESPRSVRIHTAD